MEQTGYNVMPSPLAPQYLHVTGNRNQRKQKEPDKFKGDKVEWADFIAHFDMKSALEKRFSPHHHENALRAVFRQWKRESKEFLMDYGSDVMISIIPHWIR